MQTDTIAALTRLNQVFYMTYADSFHKTRLTPWNGWHDLLPFLPTASPAQYVDIGCGNGRWFSFVTNRSVCFDSGIGIDLDTYLLGQARFAFIKDNRFRFYQGDIIENFDGCISHIGQPQIITSFGLWHHIPSFSLRHQMLSKLRTALVPGGHLIVSFWQFAEDPAYAAKLIHPAQAAAHLSIPESEFEPGDYFLGWQTNTSVLRYCHSFTDAEIQETANSITTDYHIITGSGNDSTNKYIVF